MRSTSRKKTTPSRTRLRPEVRRELIVEAAFKIIAEEGFEGLRTRDIAQRVGINSATLHHYFPTKEDLITGVADHLETRLRSEKSQSAGENVQSALATFDSQFEDVILYQLEKPDILAVYREFVGRAARDRAIHALVERLHKSWRSGLIKALMRGKENGTLRPGIDPEAAAGLILCTAWGLVSYVFPSKKEFDATVAQLRSWVAPEPNTGRAKKRRSLAGAPSKK
jgi:AcrR family transcriptional regulator